MTEASISISKSPPLRSLILSFITLRVCLVTRKTCKSHRFSPSQSLPLALKAQIGLSRINRSKQILSIGRSLALPMLLIDDGVLPRHPAGRGVRHQHTESIPPPTCQGASASAGCRLDVARPRQPTAQMMLARDYSSRPSVPSTPGRRLKVLSLPITREELLVTASSFILKVRITALV